MTLPHAQTEIEHEEELLQRLQTLTPPVNAPTRNPYVVQLQLNLKA